MIIHGRYVAFVEVTLLAALLLLPLLSSSAFELSAVVVVKVKSNGSSTMPTKPNQKDVIVKARTLKEVPGLA